MPTARLVHGRKAGRLFSSRRGFYLVSPFLGFFFLMITISFTLVVVTEKNQQIDTAKAGATQELVFASYAIQADAFDVFFQNYLQGVLDSYVVGSGVPYKDEISDSVESALSGQVEATYKQLYQDAFSLDCKMVDRMYSMVILKLNSEGVDVLGTGRIFNSEQVTALWPYMSRYGLSCTMIEPPIISTVDFRSRWYYLDAQCICCQELGYEACAMSYQPTPGRTCPNC